ncbi:LpqB family beta-propeller domain-containing protein [Micromonospora sp. NPDC000089]|uniref:LpqB family beta-propeller domain-containing protein n=1 Tax=unclassified Micromonospora TaxID=2617518 RepID=UPI00367C5BD4
MRLRDGGSRRGGSRPRLVAAAGAVLLALGAAGCGIPSRTDVRVDGEGPAVQAGSSSFRRDEPPTRSVTNDRPTFVDNFLAAAAGEPEGAYQRVGLFIAPENRARLQVRPGNEVSINVVRVTERPVITENANGEFDVRLPVQQVGQLRANGVLGPAVATEAEYTFSLRTAREEGGEGTGLYVTNPPNVLLLSTDALRSYYQAHTIYFWNSDQTRLVADQRYQPLAVPRERLVSEVVKWLIGGPSEWLGPGVSRLPDRTALINNAVETDDRWEVAVDLPGDDRGKLEKLATQLAWSLPDLDGQLQLTTRNQSRVRIDDLERHRQAHPPYQLPQSLERFTVYDGAVHPLVIPGEPSGPVPLAPADNHAVVSAAFRQTEERMLAALVTDVPGGRQRLAVGTGSNPVPPVQLAPQTFRTIGRPLWLRDTAAEEPYGLVVADGQLYRFDGSARMIRVPVGVTGAVSAAATSLDGHRIALIVGGALWVAALNLDGGVVSLGPPRAVPTTLTELSAVDWAAENDLVLAGTSGRSSVYEVSVDGTVQTELVGEVGARVTHLAAYPTNPVNPRPGLQFMYEANGVSYRFPSTEKIRVDQVQDVPSTPTGGRPGSATAPFFLY